MICFGSKVDGAFCLDTVFVVASAEPWAAADAQEMDLDDAFRTCTASAIVIVLHEMDRNIRVDVDSGATVDPRP